LCGLGHTDLLFGLASEARGLAGEGCGLARPRRGVWFGQVPGEHVARQEASWIQGAQMKDGDP
jgi:hypothetical protein